MHSKSAFEVFSLIVASPPSQPEAQFLLFECNRVRLQGIRCILKKHKFMKNKEFGL